MVEKAKKDRKRRTISSFTILLIILIALAIITVTMAAAGTQGVTGATVVRRGHRARQRLSPMRCPCVCSCSILGGFLGIVTETGALDAGIAALVKKLKGNELILIPILMFIFSIGGTTYGMCEETVPFYLLLAATMVAAGFDSIVGAAVVLLGAGCGVLGSTVNPFAVGAAIDSLSSTGLVINQGVIIGLRRGVVAGHACYLHRVRHALRQEGQSATRARPCLTPCRSSEAMRAAVRRGASRRPTRPRRTRTEKRS